MNLNQDIAYKELSSFFQKNPTPLVVFGTGTSCAIDSRFGMSKLIDKLIEKVPSFIRGRTSYEKEWSDVVKALGNNNDLELAMNNVKTDELVNIIVKVSGTLIANLDKEFCNKIFRREIEWPASILFKRLVDRLPESDRILHVVTPNYDMLAEYVFEVIGIPYINGFWGNVCKKFNWELSSRSIKLNKEYIQTRNKISFIWKDLKHINLYKVHGSINTFWFENEVVQNDLWSWNPPEDCERVMVTPGLSKYEKLTHFRKELIEQYDKILETKDSFLFIGYGFNDTHIERYIIPKLKTQKCSGIIVTRDSNSRIQNLLNESENLWLVCMEDKSGNSGTRIFNKQYKDWLYLYDKQLWNINKFTRELIGD